MLDVPNQLSERAGSQTARALLAIRDLILRGQLAPGERVSELVVVARIGISRTPVRAALARLEEEGLLESIPAGGYAVRCFSDRDIFDAIEIRGCLEGLAARLAAEKGVPAGALDAPRQCLRAIDSIMSGGTLTEEIFSNYVALNERFHAQLHDLADSATLSDQIERAVAFPFASPSAFVMAQSRTPDAVLILTLAQEQHRAVIEAIERREGTRAEMVMREHARLASRNLRGALQNREALNMIPGATLIRQRAT